MRDLWSKLIRPGISVLGALIMLLGTYQCGEKNKIPISTKSKQARKLFLQARAEGEDLHLEKANQLLTEAIEADPAFAMAYLFRARFTGSASNLKNDLQAAVNLADNASAGEQLLIRAYQAYYGENNPTKALEFHRQLVQMYPQDNWARWRLGVFYQILGQIDQAEQELNHVISREKDFAPAYLTLGYMHKGTSEYNKAEQAFLNYIRLKPEQPNPYDSLGDLYSKMGKYEQAIDNYKQALDRNPSFTDSKLKIGTNLIFMGRFTEGRTAIQEAIELETSVQGKVEDMEMIIRSFLYENDFAEALAQADKTIIIAQENNMPDDVALLNLVKCAICIEIGDLDKAEISLIECKKAFDDAAIPSFYQDIYADSIYFWEAALAAKRKDFASAIAIANKYRDSLEMSANPNRMKYHFGLLGFIELERGYFTIAREYFRHAEINEPLFMYYNALAEAKSGSRVEASKLFRKAAAWNQDSFWYAMIRKKAEARK